MIVGIAYHSPLDIVSLFPLNVTYSISSGDVVDIFVSDHLVREYKAKVQIVFTSARNLTKENLPILDQGAWGKVITVTTEQIEKLLKDKKEFNDTPDWVDFKV